MNLYRERREVLDIRRVGVVGCGLMGSGIAEVAAKSGFDVMVREVDDEVVERGKYRIRQSMDRAVEKEKMTLTEQEAAWDHLHFTAEVSELESADIVVEAIIENLDAKAKLFHELDILCPEHTIFASNTSSLTVTDIAAATSRADRFVGLHFFNPVPVMRLVEVVRTIATSQETVDRAVQFSKALGKVPIAAKDNSGFVVNLLLVPYLLDAIRQLEHGVATVEDIDAAMALGLGYPMGPFILCDFVGIDTLHQISEIMFDEYRDPRYAPPPLLKRIVTMGRFGRKSGKGFYDWSGEKPIALPV